ncbi:hypothetical protein [Mucilaginibacter lappiensis]|uniref:PH domain-containing protein n=1 Tax=Mucilaginibacter lappiensis TaxID=354630 RepID=A0A841JC57_9SPHI|nr:hypothetical protein [Mucilaginibacter lappiensis]MBB6126055.1 hypothetical protein [Mucilaginibacter lappiensis]
MPQFVSKLQHNTYEKGEFSDKQPRNLDETIDLIKNFPWDIERPLTDIQLTGPSVTIQDNELNYLKLGLYFGGKFCVYYLDKDNHLYEYHVPDLDSVSKLIADFFVSNLDLKLFEKHFFNVGNRAHFITQSFVYTLSMWKFVILIALFFIYLFLISLSVFTTKFNDGSLFVTGLMLLLSGSFLIYTLFVYFKNRHLYLQISKGNGQFSFGLDEQHIVTYNKSDIKQILYYAGKGNSSRNLTGEVTVYFKDGSDIKIPNLLISVVDLLAKFKDHTDNYTVPVNFITQNIFQ